jgi:Ribonuclease G/E
MQSQCQTFFVDVDERREATLIHDDTMPRYRIVVHHEFYGCRKSDVYCSFLWFGVFCLFASLWCLKFAIQWK